MRGVLPALVALILFVQGCAASRSTGGGLGELHAAARGDGGTRGTPGASGAPLLPRPERAPHAAALAARGLGADDDGGGAAPGGGGAAPARPAAPAPCSLATALELAATPAGLLLARCAGDVVALVAACGSAPAGGVAWRAAGLPRPARGPRRPSGPHPA